MGGVGQVPHAELPFLFGISLPIKLDDRTLHQLLASMYLQIEESDHLNQCTPKI